VWANRLVRPCPALVVITAADLARNPNQTSPLLTPRGLRCLYRSRITIDTGPSLAAIAVGMAILCPKDDVFRVASVTRIEVTVPSASSCSEQAPLECADHHVVVAYEDTTSPSQQTFRLSDIRLLPVSH